MPSNHKDLAATEFEPIAGALAAVNAACEPNLQTLRLCAWLAEQAKPQMITSARRLFENFELCKDMFVMMTDTQASLRAQIKMIETTKARLLVGAAAAAYALPDPNEAADGKGAQP